MAGRLAWALLGTLSAQGAGLLAAVINARLLGRAEFGKLAILQSAAVTVAALGAAGLGVTTTRFVARLDGREPARIGRILGVCETVTSVTGLAFGGAFVLAAPWLAGLFKLAGLETQLRWSSVQILFATLNAYQVGALAGFSAFSRLARIGVIQGAVALGLAALGSWYLGLTGAVVAGGAAAFASWVQHQVALREECRNHGIKPRYGNLLDEAGVLWRFALPSALSGWVGGLAATAASTLLVRQEQGPQALAIFNASNSVRVAVLFAPALISRVSTPVLCRLSAADDSRAYARAFWRYLALTCGLAAAAAAVAAAAGPWVLWLFGKEFRGGQEVLGVLMLAAVLEATSIGLFQTIYAHGRIWTQVGIMALWGATLVTLVVALPSRWGAMALAVGYLGAWSVAAVLYAAAARTVLAGPPPDGALAEELP